MGPGRHTAPHGLHDGPDRKILSLRPNRSNTLYLKCVIALGDLAAKGLAWLHINQALSYYEVIMAAPAPNDIHENHPDAQ